VEVVQSGARGARPGRDPVFSQAVVEHDVARADPPDEREPGAARPTRAALRAVRINADVLTVGDFQPEALPGVSRPPGVDAVRLVQLVLGGWISEQDPRR
jgi:hypothetical protein